jgi:TadE-like protein
MTKHPRGQALIESAIALPVFLLALFGVVWALQSGVLGERVQLAARYGGMVSAQSNPYDSYSLYAAYSASAGMPIVPPCNAPPAAAIIGNTSPITDPAPASQPFWQPDAGSVQSTPKCSRTISTAAGLSSPKLLGHVQISIDATNTVPPFLQAFAGAVTSWHASVNELQSPDMSTLVVCYPDLSAAFSASVSPVDGGGAAPANYVIGTPETGPLAIDGSCGG